MVIQVTFRDPATSTEQKYEFDQSPVRIGRNPLNNVVLEGNFVSGWHGIIRFDETGTYYFDLGSTNGTCLDGKRLPKNTATPIRQVTRLTIWMFELIVSPARPGTLAPEHRPTPIGTLAGPSRAPSAVATTLVAELPSAHSPTAAARIISVGGMRTPPPPSAAVASRFPPQEPTLPLTEQATAMLDRYERLMRAFSAVLYRLKKGYEQIGADIGVRPLTGNTRLHRARTQDEILQYFRDPANDPEACARDLNAVVAEVAFHDQALVRGIETSFHALLARLDPNAQDMKVVASLWSGAKAKAKWSSYQEVFRALLAEDAALHAEIFGQEFASAYASLVGDELGSMGPEG
jgi:predicted component of type VI protein secretion system